MTSHTEKFYKIKLFNNFGLRTHTNFVKIKIFQREHYIKISFAF